MTKAKAVFPPITYEISNGRGIFQHYFYIRGPLGSMLAGFCIGWTLGIDGIGEDNA